MSYSKSRVTPERTALIKKAVYIIGSQSAVADILQVTQVTVSRWSRGLGPVPQAVILWAKQIVRDDDNKASRA